MDPIILDAPVQEKRRLEYAGFWIRVVAAIIDSIVLIVVDRMITFVFFNAVMTNPFDSAFSFTYAYIMYNLVSIIVGAAYAGVLESSERQATLGKMAVGIRVGNTNGERISFMNAIGRHFAKYLSALVLLIGYIMVAFDDRNQGLHDKIADTVVYYG